MPNSFFLSLCRIESRILRNWIRYVVGKLEGGEYFSLTLREIFKRFYDVEIGLYTHGGCFDMYAVDRGTKIGRYCSFARPTRILNLNHPMDFKSTHAFFFNPILGQCTKDLTAFNPLTVGSDVWMGAQAMILPHVSNIGTGAVIGAGAVVHHDVPPYAVVVGSPARVVRYRFSPAVIEELLASRWWENPLAQLDINEFSRPYMNNTPAQGTEGTRP